MACPRPRAHEAATEAHRGQRRAVTEPPPGGLPGTPCPGAGLVPGSHLPRMGGEPLAVSLYAAKAPIDGWLALPAQPCVKARPAPPRHWLLLR